MTDTVKAYIEKLEELLMKSNEISTFYGKVIDANAMFLRVHGITASNEEIIKGMNLRSEFNEIKELAKSLKQQIEAEEKTVSDEEIKDYIFKVDPVKDGDSEWLYGFRQGQLTGAKWMRDKLSNNQDNGTI